MRTNIEINDDLMAAAMAAGGFKTKREAVEEGLRLLSRRKVYDGLLALRGQCNGTIRMRVGHKLLNNSPLCKSPRPPIKASPQPVDAAQPNDLGGYQRLD